MHVIVSLNGFEVVCAAGDGGRQGASAHRASEVFMNESLMCGNKGSQFVREELWIHSQLPLEYR